MEHGKAKQVLLTDLICNVSGILLKKQYSPASIENYRLVWRKLLHHFDSLGEKHYRHDIAFCFLKEKYGIVPGEPMNTVQVNALRKIQVLEDYYSTGEIIQKQKRRKYDYPIQFRSIFDKYALYRQEKGFSRRTNQTVMLYLERFGEYLGTAGVINFSEIKERHVTGFANYLTQFQKPTVAMMLSTIKGLLIYAYEQKHLCDDLSKTMPKSGYRKNRRIPSAYAQEEVERILKTVDRSNPMGKRDYAILMLAAKLGIRAGDIVNLKLSDLKWDKNCIEFVQEKTENTIVLPILNDVGEAIIDYLKYGRPKTGKTNVFIILHAPYYEFTGKSLHYLVKKYITLAGIKVKREHKFGPHSLRHSLASMLLNENTPLPVISEILGHADSKTTGSYLKIDISKLRDCALEVSHATL